MSIDCFACSAKDLRSTGFASLRTILAGVGTGIFTFSAIRNAAIVGLIKTTAVAGEAISCIDSTAGIAARIARLTFKRVTIAEIFDWALDKAGI